MLKIEKNAFTFVIYVLNFYKIFQIENNQRLKQIFVYICKTQINKKI